MKTLEKDWLTAGLIDFEYKKYVLLSYLQSVKTNFQDKKLYPDLSDLHKHYEYSLYFKSGLEQMANNFPKRIKGFNQENLGLDFEQESQPESEFLTEIECITNYALPRFRKGIAEGEELRQTMEEKIEITPVGILPLYKNDGYMFLYEPLIKETKVYQYNLTIFENNHEKQRGIKTYLVDTVRYSPTNTFENLKIELVKKFKHLPNPATYLIESKLLMPLHETLLPLAKKKMVSYL